MKILGRFAFLVIIINIILHFIIEPFSLQFQDVDTIKEWIAILWGFITIISVLSWYFYLYWHWAMNGFVSKGRKRLWFLILFIGTILYFIGPIIYYFVVVERGKGLARPV
jgi:hypothetical protein